MNLGSPTEDILLEFKMGMLSANMFAFVPTVFSVAMASIIKKRITGKHFPFAWSLAVVVIVFIAASILFSIGCSNYAGST